MKRLAIALVTIALIVGSSLVSLWNFSQLRDEASPLLEQLEQQAQEGRWQEAEAGAETFLTLWQQHEAGLVRFTRRSPVEQIGSLSVQLPVLARCQEKADFRAALRELGYCLEMLWDSQIPRFNTLF